MSRPAIPAEVVHRVRATAGFRCGYCHSPQRLVHAVLEIEHIISVASGGTDEESNLWLSCPICNGHKSAKTFATDPDTNAIVPLFNRRTQKWEEHFCWSQDGLRIIGLTPIGRATVVALHLSTDEVALTVRSYWIAAGWHPPKT